MLVELRSGFVGLVVGETVIFLDDKQPLSLSYLTDDMKNSNKFNDSFDIMKVSNIKKWDRLWSTLWTLENITNDLLWQRPEPKEMMQIGEHEFEIDYVKDAFKKLGFMVCGEDEKTEPESPKREIRLVDSAYKFEYIESVLDEMGFSVCKKEMLNNEECEL
jgi:hypothetical protein